MFLVFGGGDICNPEKSVNSGFGKGYVFLTKAKDELRREFFNVKINYKLNIPKAMVIVSHSFLFVLNVNELYTL